MRTVRQRENYVFSWTLSALTQVENNSKFVVVVLYQQSALVMSRSTKSRENQTLSVVKSLLKLQKNINNGHLYFKVLLSGSSSSKCD